MEDYEEYCKIEEKCKNNYKNRILNNIPKESKKNFKKIRRILLQKENEEFLDGFYFPKKAIQLFKNKDTRYFLNKYMDLKISDILNMIEDNTNIKKAIEELFENYDSESALGWGDNFITVLKNI